MRIVPITSLQDAAVDFLKRAAEDYERATRTRREYIVMARRHGLTNQQIGDALGITEASVRSLVKRADVAA